MTASDTTTTTQGELEKLVSDLRGLLANKDLDAVPEIKLLRQRLDGGLDGTFGLVAAGLEFFLQ